MAEGISNEANTKEQLLGEIAELKAQISELKTARRADKIYDANYFGIRLEDEVARSTRYKYEFTFLLVEMDNFARYSKNQGKESIEELVGMFNIVMRDTLRKTDIYCHLEPGKFGIILPHTNTEGGCIAAEKLRQRVERVFTMNSMSAKVPLSLSVGAATYPKDAVSDEHLVQVTREALSKAKTKGGNCIWMASANDAYSPSKKDARAVFSQNALLLKAIDDEVLRCSRYRQQFCLMILSLAGPDMEKANLDKELKTMIMQAAFKLINMTIRNIDRNYFHTENRFAVLLPNTDVSGAQIVAQKLVDKLSTNRIIQHNGQDINVGVNIGIGSFPMDGISRDGLMKQVEAALQQSVKSGINRIIYASSISKLLKKDQRDVRELITNLKKVGQTAVYNLLSAVDLTENYVKPHSQAVANYALAIGQGLGLSSVVKGQLRVAALMHDLGKICVPDSIVTKPDTLNTSEWEIS